ncbi:TolC family outer membrane protein [Citrobacter koseri]|uniref:TolC family outer membrane protein n=1 Tax=Citrobacter koseri TaxID=545 RepID=UPI0028BE5F32|nr:TolC family outer membrane protein [Citrobacter koseri]MDT7487291.1 TolC family outer membrane protein [Citrobacter koseri]
MKRNKIIQNNHIKFSEGQKKRNPQLFQKGCLSLLPFIFSALLFCSGWPIKGLAESTLQKKPELLHAPNTPSGKFLLLTDNSMQSNDEKISLVQAYEHMLLNNPKIYAAQAARDIGLDEKNIARAGLLPKISINYIRNRTQRKEYIEQPGLLPSLPDRNYTIQDQFFGKRVGLNVEQVLFDYSAISTYRMGVTQAKYAEVEYRLQLQQQAISLIDAYLNAVLARELLILTQYQLRIYENTLHDNKKILAQGEGTQIDVLETRTQLDTTHAQVIVYENELANKMQELSMLLGEQVNPSQLMSIDLASDNVFLHTINKKKLLDDALQQNPEIQAARLIIHYNELSIEREKGQFMPRVSLFASHEKIDSDNINNKGRNYTSDTIGMQISIPIFNGGGNYYSTRQAYNQREKARHELYDKKNDTSLFIEKYYQVCSTSMQRIHMLRQNVINSSNLARALRKSVIGGERTNSDVLNAENQIYQSQQALLHSVIELLQAYSKMQFYAGRFSEEDILTLNSKMIM